MKWTTYTLIILLILGITFYLVVLGGPVKRTFEFHGCSVSYTYYLTNNAYCTWATHGHCATNDFVITNVKREVGKCFCDRPPGKGVNVNAMMELIHSDPFLTEDYERLKDDYTINAKKTICDYKEILFVPYYIE